MSKTLEKPINDKSDIEIEIYMANVTDNYIRGFVEGYTGKTIENLLKEILKRDLDLENTKEEIFDNISQIIFRKYPAEIEKLENKAIKLAKEGMIPNEILDKLLK